MAKRQAGAMYTEWVNSGYRTAGEIDCLADLRPDPSVTKKKLNLNLCKKGKVRADQERFESFTFIDDVKVVSLKKKFQQTQIAVLSRFSLWAPGHCLFWYSQI